jgi:hypothetical protein
MEKHLKTVKTIFIIGILLISLFAALMPTSAALIPSTVTLNIKLTNPDDANEKVVPLSGPMTVGVDIGYLVSGIFAQAAIGIFSSRSVPATISLSVEETPEWMTAIIQPNVVSPVIKQGWSYENATLKISFLEDAPAMGDVKIRVKMESERVPGLLFHINEKTAIGEISFTPNYLPIISVKPLGNFQEISPGEVARFDIEIENMGNAKTVVDFTILTNPEGWSPNIISSTTISENTKTTVQLLVQPPYGFGYHNDREQVQIKIIPSYFADPLLKGREYTETFTIQSRGFSTPGFEIIFTLIALIGVGFLIKKQKEKK